MSKMSQWCEFNTTERKYIYERDKSCIYCGSRFNNQVAHIFISRAHGGKGSRVNGVLLCTKCHQILDNPIGKQSEQSRIINQYCKNYLINKEHIKLNDEFLSSLKYKKMV